MVTDSSILAWRIPMDRGAWRATVHGVTKSRTEVKRFSTRATTKPNRSSSCSPRAWGLATFPGVADGCSSDCLLQRSSYIRDTAFRLLCAPTQMMSLLGLSPLTPTQDPPNHGGVRGAEPVSAPPPASPRGWDLPGSQGTYLSPFWPV